MVQIILTTLVLRLLTVRSECGHLYLYPLDVCVGSLDDYDKQASWEITCNPDTNPPSYDVNFWDNGVCEGDANETRGMQITQNDASCGGINACVCAPSTDCDTIEVTTSISCPFDVFSGHEFESNNVETNSNPDSGYESTSTTVVILDMCVGWSEGDEEEGVDPTYRYQMWTCNDAFEAQPESEDDPLPIVRKFYTDATCATEDPDYYENDYYTDPDTNAGYETDYGGDPYNGNQCESIHDIQCEWKAPTNPNLASCSHVFHYPVNECGHQFSNDEWYDGYYTEPDYGDGGDYGYGGGSVIGGNRRRLNYGSSSEFTCSRDDQGTVTYSHHSYGSDDCTGNAYRTNNVTAQCTDAICNCNAASGEVGDSSACVIAREGWEYHCNGVIDDSYHSLYVTNVCIDRQSYSCFPDNGIWKRDYVDDTCVTPFQSECWSQEAITCNVNGLSDPSDTTGCGYVKEYETTYAMDVCYGDSYSGYYGGSSASSFKYWCEVDPLDETMVTFHKKLYYSTSDCSDADTNVYEEDISDLCASDPLYSDDGYECECGEGAQCDVAQRVSTHECDGDEASISTNTEYFLMDQCVPHENHFISHTCSNSELSEIHYSDAGCTEVRDACMSDDASHVSTSECVMNVGACGYFHEYPLDVCAYGYSSLGSTYAHKYSCDANGVFWKNMYLDMECTQASTDEPEPEDVSWECADDNSTSCLCVPDSQCSYRKRTSSDLCYSSDYLHANVMGVCQGEHGEFYKETCTEDGNYHYTYYVDSVCETVRNDEEWENYDREGEVHVIYGGGSTWTEEVCEWSIQYTESNCADAYDSSVPRDDSGGSGSISTTEAQASGDDDGASDVHEGNAGYRCTFHSIFVLFLSCMYSVVSI